MTQIITDYIENLKKEYKTGQAKEHSYRPALKALLERLDQSIIAVNEPKRQKVGAPDYVIQKGDIPIGFIEAKDIDVGLDEVEKSEQLKRYYALGNLVLTNYLEFRFFDFEDKYKTVEIARLENGKIKVLEENFQELEDFIKSFMQRKGQTIKTAPKLARMMALKARLMRDVIEKALKNENEETDLNDQYKAFKDVLIHDLTKEQFADIYSQTIAYGMFAARFNDNTPKDFSRQEASYLLPKTNPFLRKLFNHIAGPDLDIRVTWIVDSLVEIFAYTDVKAILASMGNVVEDNKDELKKDELKNDPVIHFFETFLKEYDPKLRKARGVYYTPLPVVKFIVKAVDEILKTEFDLPDGLADTSKINIKVDNPAYGHKGVKNKYIEKEYHKVQVLDPATGTGTFLNEVIKEIYKKYEGQLGIWSKYVEEHLLPRINGFELLMASYAMCHLKLALTLNQTGYHFNDNQRLKVFLTNSLEEAHDDTASLFSSWLSQEAKEASQVKNEAPIMVVLGNPPYSVSSSNKSDWIENLLKNYKKDLNEKNIQPLSDDYIKFIRFAQYFVEKNKTGIIAMITNNSFLDGVIHRRMRESILKAFDKVYIYDLHGNSKKKETCPDGSKDENVFDIMQGVQIMILVKK